MPIKKRIQIRNVQNVAASSVALITLPVKRTGLRYHHVIIQHGFASGTNTAAGAVANITDIKVKVNNRIQRVFSGAELRDMNILNGTAYDVYGSTPNTSPGVGFPIYFAEPWLPDEAAQDALAWQTKNWDSFQIEVTLGAASTPTLTAYAVTDESDKDSGLINKVIRQKAPAAGVSFDLALDPRDFLRVVSVYPDSGGSNAPSKVTLRLNSDVYHELTNSANSALLTQYGMTPAASGRTASVYDLVLDHDGLLGSAPNVAGVAPTLTIEAGGAMSGTSTVLLQRVGPLD